MTADARRPRRAEGGLRPLLRGPRHHIVDMGVVEDVRVDGTHVEVDLVLTTGWCPFVASMSSTIPDALTRLPGVETVDVKVVWDPVWTMDRLSPSAREKLQMPLDELEPYRAARSAA